MLTYLRVRGCSTLDPAFLLQETGRSKASRKMVLDVAEILEVSLRDQNTLLLAAALTQALEKPALAELD